MDESADFRSSTGFLLSQLGVRATRMWLSILTERGLTPHQHGVVLTLRASGPMTLTELSNAMLIDPRNMGPVIEPLEVRGLIVRSSDPHDRRRRLTMLTAPGRVAADELSVATHTIEQAFLAPLGDRDRRTLNTQLRKLWEHHGPGSE